MPPPTTAPPNIASVPHRSPFRYPGGKTWLTGHIRQWLTSQPTRPTALIEPFCGGGAVSLTAVLEDLADTAIMVELDPHVAAVWSTMLSPQAEELATRIETFTCDEPHVRALLNTPPPDQVTHAFTVIVRNRVQRGGILTPGAGLMRAGERGRGIASRWYPATLARRIRTIAAHADRFTFIHGDGMTTLTTHNTSDVVFFIDPPYTAGGKNAGARLYEQHTLNHEDLFAHVTRLRGDVLMTYDNTPTVQELTNRHHLDHHPVAMRNTHNAVLSELLIGKDLTWARPTAGRA